MTNKTPNPVTDETLGDLKNLYRYIRYDYEEESLDSTIALLESLPRTKDGVRVRPNDMVYAIYSTPYGKQIQKEKVCRLLASPTIKWNRRYYYRKNAEEALQEEVGVSND